MNHGINSNLPSSNYVPDCQQVSLEQNQDQMRTQFQSEVNVKEIKRKVLEKLTQSRMLNSNKSIMNTKQIIAKFLHYHVKKQSQAPSYSSSVLEPKLAIKENVDKYAKNMSVKGLQKKKFIKNKQSMKNKPNLIKQASISFNMSHFQMKADEVNGFKFNVNKPVPCNSLHGQIKKNKKKNNIDIMNQSKERCQSASNFYKLTSSSSIYQMNSQMGGTYTSQDNNAKPNILRSVAYQKQSQLVNKWLSLDLSSMIPACKGKITNQILIKVKHFIEQSLGIKNLTVDHLMEGLKVLNIIQNEGMQEKVDQLKFSLEYIQKIIREKCSLKANKLRQKGLIIIKTENAYIQNQGQSGVKKCINDRPRYENVRSSTLQDHASDSTYLKGQSSIKSSNFVLQHPQRQYFGKQYKYYLHYRPGTTGSYRVLMKSRDRAQNSINSSIGQQLKDGERIHSISTSSFMKRYNNSKKMGKMSTEVSQAMNMTLNMNRTIDGTTNNINKSENVNQIGNEIVQNPLESAQTKSQVPCQDKTNTNHNNKPLNTLNATALKLGQDISKQVKYRNRSKLFKDFQLTGKLWQRFHADHKLSSSDSSMLNKTLPLNSYSNLKQVGSEPEKKKSFLKKRHGRYAAIISKIGLKKTPSMCIPISNSSISQVQEQQPPIPCKQQSEQQPAQNSQSEDSNIEDQGVKLTDDQIQKILQSHFTHQSKRKGSNDSQQKNQDDDKEQIVWKNKFKNKMKAIKHVFKARQRQSFSSEGSSMRKSSYRNSISKVDNQLSIQRTEKQSIKKKQSSFLSKRQSIRERFQNPLMGRQKTSIKVAKLTRWQTLQKNIQTQESMQLRSKQQKLLNELYVKNRQDNNHEKKAKKIMTQEQIKQQKLDEIQKKRLLKQKLILLRHDFQQMLKNKVDIDGPSVFCRIVEDRRNRIGQDLGLSQFQSIYKLKKPYNLITNYSNSNIFADYSYSFNQDSLQLDFMRKVGQEFNLLGQKSIDLNQF